MKFKKILVMGILSFLLAPKAGAQTFSEACYTPGHTRFSALCSRQCKAGYAAHIRRWTGRQAGEDR